MSDARKFLANSSVVFAGTMLGNVFSYLFNVSMGRLLGPSDYGRLSVTLSLIGIVSVAGGAVLTISMRYAGELYHQGRFRALAALARSLKSLMFFGSIGLFLICALLAVPIAHFFALGTPGIVVSAATIFLFSLSTMVNKGVLQGAQRFRPVAAVSAGEMGSRLVVGLLLVRLGFSVYGGIFAVVAASAIAYLITLPSYRSVLRLEHTEPAGSSTAVDRKDILSYAGPTVLATVMLTFFLSLDSLTVKHYFSAEQAGLYAAVSTVANIIVYVSAPVLPVMFPMISQKLTTGEKHYKTFLLAFMVTLVGALAVLGLYMLAPTPIMRLLYGPTYASLATLLPLAGMYVFFYTVVNFLANYFLAIRDFSFVWLMGVSIVVQLLLAHSLHGSIEQVIRDLIAGIMLLTLLMLGRYLYLKRTQILAILTGEYGKEA
jgi:O-antigen/teichoic acid export membrane protein